MKMFLQINSMMGVKYLPHIFGKAKFQTPLVCVIFQHILTSLQCCHTGNINTVDKQLLASNDINSKYLLLKIRLLIRKRLVGNIFKRQYTLLYVCMYVCPFPCQSSVSVYTKDQQTRCQEIKRGGGSNL